MIVVSDTTPLISLLKIDRIGLLEKLFGQVLIPQAVFDELTLDERFKFEADQIRRKQFIKVKAVKNPESASILKRATGHINFFLCIFPGVCYNGKQQGRRVVWR